MPVVPGLECQCQCLILGASLVYFYYSSSSTVTVQYTGSTRRLVVLSPSQAVCLSKPCQPASHGE